MSYNDLHQHVKLLEDHDLLYRISRQINKDHHLHPLVRWQFRGGIPEDQRRAFYFENVVDSKGRQYTFPVLVGALAASTKIYSLGLGCKPDEIFSKWSQALSKPIPPEIVTKGCAHDNVIMGKDLEKKGLDIFPVPISTPGFDNAPYTTCSHWISKDLETHVSNIGNYRGQIKAKDRVSVYPSGYRQHIMTHFEQCKKMGKPLEAALLIGAPPLVSYASVQKVPYGVDEFAVAGGLANEPIRVVKCKTVDLEVPAEAEIVIEGLISTEYLELEGPFGESHGYMHPRRYNPYLDVTAITYRNDAYFTSIISQVTPSESSSIKKKAMEAFFLRHLTEAVGLKSVMRVVLHEPLTNLRKVVIIQLRKPRQVEVWRALHTFVGLQEGVGKIIIAVDEDIDPDNLDAVFWAIGYRIKPHLDVEINRGTVKGHGPPFGRASKSEDTAVIDLRTDDSALLINATLKEPFPPVSLPKQKFMLEAKKIWEELGFPALKPEAPWYGYSLGDWDETLDQEAEQALNGDYWATGEKLKANRKKI